MKLQFYKFTFLLSLALTSFGYGINKHNIDNSNIANQRSSLINRKAVNPLWITYNPTLINTTHTYDFDTYNEPFSNGQHYSSDNPDYNLIVPKYYDGMVANYVNASCFLAFAYDSTNERKDIPPASGFMNWSNISSNGKAFFGIDTSIMLPYSCEISDDNMQLKNCNSAFWFPDSSINPTIRKGLLLYRSSYDGSFSGWDGYYYLDKFASSDLRIQFNENKYCQVVILYEVHNFDDGWWIFQNHEYYNVVGVYNFRTSDKI